MEDLKGARYLPCDAFDIDTQWGKVRARMAMPELCLMQLNTADHCDGCAYITILYHVARTTKILDARDEREEREWWDDRPW